MARWCGHPRYWCWFDSSCHDFFLPVFLEAGAAAALASLATGGEAALDFLAFLLETAVAILLSVIMTSLSRRFLFFFLGNDTSGLHSFFLLLLVERLLHGFLDQESLHLLAEIGIPGRFLGSCSRSTMTFHSATERHRSRRSDGGRHDRLDDGALNYDRSLARFDFARHEPTR